MIAQDRRAMVAKLRVARYADNPDAAICALNPINRQALIDYLDAANAHRGWGFCISMPCGGEQHFKVHGDIPFGDLPCPCGRDNHFMVRYSISPLSELQYIS